MALKGSAKPKFHSLGLDKDARPVCFLSIRPNRCRFTVGPGETVVGSGRVPSWPRSFAPEWDRNAPLSRILQFVSRFVEAYDL